MVKYINLQKFNNSFDSYISIKTLLNIKKYGE